MIRKLKDYKSYTVTIQLIRPFVSYSTKCNNMFAGQSQGYFQGGQSFSPPTKQSNPTVAQCHDNSIESIHSQDDHCVKLVFRLQ